MHLFEVFLRMHQNPSISGMSAPATGWMRKRWIHDQMNDTRNDYSLPFEKPQRVRLLVDGDSFASEQVHWAVASLARSFDVVNAVIFGAPGLTKNKKMRTHYCCGLTFPSTQFLVEKIKQQSPTMMRSFLKCKGVPGL